MDVVVALLTLSIALGNGAGVPGTYLVAGVVLALFAAGYAGPPWEPLVGSHHRPTSGHTEPPRAFDFCGSLGIKQQSAASTDGGDLVRIEGVRGSNPLSSTERSSRFSGDHLHVWV